MTTDPTPLAGESASTLEERLRGLAEFGLSPKSRVLSEAADELARLRAENARLTANLRRAYREALSVAACAREGATKVDVEKERDGYLCYAEMVEYIARVLREGGVNAEG